ncbi:MAG: alcohol dehydrogenase catalytic domain-containing protein, partial [Victivallales bacterium]|nr:alcohol dehydrogenase catalytic domain-containing protein [Victivallales bacterium]
MKTALHSGIREITVQEREIPKPGSGQYLIQIKACAICGSDTWWGKPARENEAIHGHESAGVVVACGEGADKFKVGDRVVCYAILGCGSCVQCRAGMPTLCGSKKFIEGGFQEYSLFPAELLFPCPDEYDFVTASLLSDAIGVPLHGMLRRLIPNREDTVCVWGLGPLGLLQTMFLKAAGVRTIIGVDTVPERLAKAKQIGASETFNASDPETPAKIADIADKVYTYVRNSKATEQVFAATRGGGSICTFVGLEGEFNLPEYFERTLVWSFYFNPSEYAD